MTQGQLPRITDTQSRDQPARDDSIGLAPFLEDTALASRMTQHTRTTRRWSLPNLSSPSWGGTSSASSVHRTVIISA